MRYQTGLGIAFVLLLGVHARAQETLLVFADVSGSLSDEQALNVRTLFEHVVRGMPASTSIEMYAITKKAGTDGPMFSGYGLKGAGNAKPAWQNSQTVKGLGKAMGDLRERYHALKKLGEKQSCILNTFRVVCQRTSALRQEGQRVNVLYLSDMLEDCADNRANVPMALKKDQTNFTSARQVLSRIPADPACLKDCQLWAVLPTGVLEGTIDALQDFWRAAFARYGLATPPTGKGLEFLVADVKPLMLRAGINTMSERSLQSAAK